MWMGGVIPEVIGDVRVGWSWSRQVLCLFDFVKIVILVNRALLFLLP